MDPFTPFKVLLEFLIGTLGFALMIIGNSKKKKGLMIAGFVILLLTVIVTFILMEPKSFGL
jgi:hypothetical protein